MTETTFTCSSCKAKLPIDEMFDGENETCEPCHDAWFAAEYAYWKPLYDGEKLAGLLEKETPHE